MIKFNHSDTKSQSQSGDRLNEEAAWDTLKLLSREDLEQIHLTSMKLLEKVGVRYSPGGRTGRLQTARHSDRGRGSFLPHRGAGYGPAIKYIPKQFTLHAWHPPA